MTVAENKSLALRFLSRQNKESDIVDEHCRIFLSGDMPCSGWMTKREK